MRTVLMRGMAACGLSIPLLVMGVGVAAAQPGSGVPGGTYVQQNYQATVNGAARQVIRTGTTAGGTGGGLGCAYYQAGALGAGPNGATGTMVNTGVGGCAGGGATGGGSGGTAGGSGGSGGGTGGGGVTGGLGCAYYQAGQVSAGPQGASGGLVNSGAGQCVGV